MDFSKALEAMKEGKKVRRAITPSGEYWFWDKNEIKYKENTFDKPFWYSAFPMYLISAEDWEIIEDIPEKEVHHILDKYQEWLEYEIKKHEHDSKESAGEGDYNRAAYFLNRQDVYEYCLAHLKTISRRE